MNHLRQCVRCFRARFPKPRDLTIQRADLGFQIRYSSLDCAQGDLGLFLAPLSLLKRLMFSPLGNTLYNLLAHWARLSCSQCRLQRFRGVAEDQCLICSMRLVILFLCGRDFGLRGNEIFIEFLAILFACGGIHLKLGECLLLP